MTKPVVRIAPNNPVFDLPVIVGIEEGLFEKAGLRVLCSPCREQEYDISSLNSLNTRLRAFRDWAHEAIGYRIYRWRGWL